MTEEKKKKKKRQRRRIIEGGSQLSRFDTNKKKSYVTKQKTRPCCGTNSLGLK